MSEVSRSQSYLQSIEEASEFIRKHDQFLVVSHVSPDGDAISSTCAMGWILEQLGKQFVMINQGPIPNKLQYLYGSKNIHSLADEPFTPSYRAVICLDCADYQRIGSVSESIKQDSLILNIDHHPTNDRYGVVNVVKDDAAATVEILYDLITSLKLTWDTKVAESIYSGLLTDTGGFRYSNTNAKVMEIASSMLQIGVNGARLAEHLLETTTYAHIQLLKRALSRLEMSEDQKICWLYITTEDMLDANAKDEDMEGIVNYPRNIDGVEVGILFKQVAEDEVKVSFRSNGEADVSMVSQHFGGGGHRKAAGATVHGKLSDVITDVIQHVKEVLKQ